MSSFGDVTHWLRQLKDGDREAIRPLWERYFHRLVGLARDRLRRRRLPRGAADEEDVALSAFDSVCRRAEEGRFPRLDDRNDLWQLLVMIATRKVADLAEREGRARRDWRQTTSMNDLREFLSTDPPPDEAAAVAEQLERLLGLLASEQERLIAVRDLEGYTNAEIAALLRCSRATVERKLTLIRTSWKQEMSE